MSATRRRRCVVTGASGFVGRRLVHALLREDVEVVALVRNPGAAESLVRSGVLVRRWSVEEALRDPGAFEEASVVFHAAAHIPSDYNDPLEGPACFRVNAQGTFDVLAAAQAARVPQIIYFSSGNVYAPNDAPVSEDATLFPSLRAPFYLASKLTGDIYADFLRRTQGLRIATLRIASVYGPGMTSGGLISTFTERVLGKEPLVVQDGGRYGVDLVYADDVVSAAITAWERSANGVFNVGSGERSTTLRIAETLMDIVGAPPDLLVLQPADGRQGFLGYPALDISRARSILGYSPTPLETGLRSYVEDHRAGRSRP